MAAVNREPELERPAVRAAAVVAVAAACLALFSLSRPGLLLGITPDVSAWFGGSVRLVHGAIPYRDFGFTQPPGFVLLSSPLGLLSEAVGTRDALAVLRMCTPLLAAANVLLMGRLTRHLGAPATTVGCAVVAFFPAELYALRGPQLEPVEILFCLMGAALVFEGAGVAGSRRLGLGGVAFGFAAVVKLPALLPALIAAGLCAAVRGRRAFPFATGAVLGFAVPALPFLLLAPPAFVRDVVGTQLGRIPASGRAPLETRLADLSGASGVGVSGAAAVAWASLLVAFVLVAFLVRRRRLNPLEWFAVCSTVAVAAAQLLPARYLPHYAAFIAPFLGLLLAVSTARVVAALRAAKLNHGTALGVAAAAAAALLGTQAWAIHAEAAPDLAPAVDAVIPPGGCALSDSPALLFTSNRFVSVRRGCNDVTDPEGATLALGTGTPAAAAMWRDAFSHADYVVTSRAIGAWPLLANSSVPAYASRHFRLVGSAGLFAYVRR